METISELLWEEFGEAPGLRFGEAAVETDTNWPAFMKVYDFSLTKDILSGNFDPWELGLLCQVRG